MSNIVFVKVNKMLILCLSAPKKILCFKKVLCIEPAKEIEVKVIGYGHWVRHMLFYFTI